MKTFLLLTLAVCSAAQEKGEKKANPVDKVVALLEEMKARLEQDQKDEQAIYDKFACWCEKTTAQKAEEIEATKAALQQLGTKILELKGLIAINSAKIVGLTKDIKKNEEAVLEFTKIREKAHARFMGEKVELEEAIAALEKAIIVLHEATSAALIQPGVATAWRVVQQVAPRYGQAISAPQLALVNEFLTMGNGHSSPQSATIQGILKDMYDTFAANLESQTKAESTAQAQFEDFIATKMKSLKTLQDTHQKKEDVKAEAETQLADATEAFDDNEAQLKGDMAFFEDTKESCDKKAAEWMERKKLRVGEIEGIEKALEILTSEDAKKIFATSIGKLFLETTSSRRRSEPVWRALGALQRSSRRTHSLRLAAIASQLRASERGHFDKVINSIEMMIETLKEEGQADEDQNDKCKEQLQDISSKVADMDWKIDNQKAAIEKLEHITKAKDEERAAVVESISKTKQEITDMEDQRKEENSAFLEEKSDDEAAIKVLEKAKEALSKYYKDNKVEMGPLEGSTKGLLQKSARIAAAEPPPDATFSSKGSRKTESKGIVSLMTQIIENLQLEISDAIKEEEAATAAYLKSVKSAKKLIKSLKKKKINLEETIAAKKEEIEQEEEVMHETIKLMEDQYKLRGDIKPDCDWIAKHIVERREKRAMEAEGLTAARDYLAGMAPPAMAQISRGGFNDDALPSIDFSSVSFLQRRSAQ